MLGKLTREEKLDGRLDFPGGESAFSVVSYQLGGLGGESVESVINKGVHNVHSLLADSNFRMDLLEDFVDVKRESLDSSLGPSLDWLSSASDGFGGFSWGHCFLLIKS